MPQKAQFTPNIHSPFPPEFVIPGHSRPLCAPKFKLAPFGVKPFRVLPKAVPGVAATKNAKIWPLQNVPPNPLPMSFAQTRFVPSFDSLLIDCYASPHSCNRLAPGSPSCWRHYVSTGSAKRTRSKMLPNNGKGQNLCKQGEREGSSTVNHCFPPINGHTLSACRWPMVCLVPVRLPTLLLLRHCRLHRRHIVPTQLLQPSAAERRNRMPRAASARGGVRPEVRQREGIGQPIHW